MWLPARIATAVRQSLAEPNTASSVPVIGTLNIYANTEAEGRTAGKAFLDVLDQRRVLVDARIA
jgi:hypothetical protein